MLRMCVCMHSRFVKNHPIWILEDGLLIFEVVLSQTRRRHGPVQVQWSTHVTLRLSQAELSIGEPDVLCRSLDQQRIHQIKKYWDPGQDCKMESGRRNILIEWSDMGVLQSLKNQVMCRSPSRTNIGKLQWMILARNKTWHLVSPDNVKNVIDYKWVYNVKRKNDGSLDRYKARLVVKGVKQ
jgi:hypothetical protein